MSNTHTVTVGAHRVTLSEMTAREVIALKRGTMSGDDVLEMVALHTVDHDYPTDILDLPVSDVLEILKAWNQREDDDALPPLTAET